MNYYLMANWKMNQNKEEITSFFNKATSNLQKEKEGCYAVIFPQAPYLSSVGEAVSSLPTTSLGVQNIGPKTSGAFTGECALSVADDFGANFILIGHSERRTIQRESNELLNQKLKLVESTNHTPVFCIGETLEERESGNTFKILETQLAEGLVDTACKKLVIAYEPVWAIGTGKVATPTEVAEVHAWLNDWFTNNYSMNPSLLYGGSVKRDNFQELIALEHVHGGLVGGASLDADHFSDLWQILCDR